MARFQLLQSGSPSEKSSGFLTKDVLLGTVHYPPSSGQILAFQAKTAQVYRLVNAQDQSLVKGQRLTRLGDNLIIEVITLKDALTISSEKATFWGNDTVTVRYTADQAPTDTQRASLIALGVDDFKVL